jgi:flagellar biosynthetic protein FliP
MKRRIGLLLFLLVAVCAPLNCAPAAESAALRLTPSGANLQSLSLPMQIALWLTALTLLPAVIMTITPFLRIIIVLHFLRQALGTQSAPSNQVMLGLALFLSILVMQPVGQEIYRTAWEPASNGAITISEAMNEGAKPMRTFLSRFAREKDVQLFVELSKAPAPKNPNDLGMQVLIPAYILSELKTAFQIGAILFLPFLVIDLVVASVTLSVGMVQLPPAMLSAPFKILLFVLVDGWTLVVGSLVKSFYQ